MPQIGEAVSPPEFISSLDHDENTCPWHGRAKDSADPMPPTDGEDDGVMPENLGGKLKENMSEKPPAADKVRVSFRTVKSLPYTIKVKGEIKERFQPVFQDAEPEEYDLQYAPHHCVPGNESLKNSPVVPFLGCDAVIANFKGKGLTSKIVDRKTVGYDVNCAENGVWLPSPYAISMGSNLWGAEEGLKALRKSGFGLDAVNMVMNFRSSYVERAIEASGGRQFHMRHLAYSNFVRKILEEIGRKLRLLAAGGCPIIGEKKQGDKFEPPMGLPGRLNLLSGEMRTLLVGKVWRPPVFADGNTLAYASHLAKAAITDKVKTIL